MLLQVENLAVAFKAGQQQAGVWLRAVDGLDFGLEGGQALCLVGESGCGKSVTALSLLGLLPTSSAKVLSGRACFENADLLALPPD